MNIPIKIYVYNIIYIIIMLILLKPISSDLKRSAFTARCQQVYIQYTIKLSFSISIFVSKIVCFVISALPLAIPHAYRALFHAAKPTPSALYYHIVPSYIIRNWQRSRRTIALTGGDNRDRRQLHLKRGVEQGL